MNQNFKKHNLIVKIYLKYINCQNSDEEHSIPLSDANENHAV